VGPCHRGMARPRVEDGGDGLQICGGGDAANALNKQSRTADKGMILQFGVGRGANNSTPKNGSTL
jgi:hypothetical protein